MNSNKESHPVSSEGVQIKTAQPQRPKVCLGALFQNAIKDIGRPDRTQVSGKREEFIKEKRKTDNSSDIAPDNVPKETSSLTNGQSCQNPTVTNSSLENCNRRTNVRSDHFKSEETQLINKKPVHNNYSSYSPQPSSVKRKDSYENEDSTNATAYRRSEREWKDKRKASYNEDNWDDTSSNITKRPSTYPHGTSTSYIQSSSSKKFEEKVHDVENISSKSIRDEDGWPEIDSEDDKKRSGDGWGRETNDGSSATTKYTSAASSKFPEKKYESPSQHRNSTQSFATNNGPLPNNNFSKHASSYGHGTSTFSIQSSSVNNVTKKFGEKVNDYISNKSTKDGWPEIDLEDDKKRSVDDGWECETNDGSLGTKKCTDISTASSKFSEKKYEPSSQHRTSTQSLATNNRTLPNRNFGEHASSYKHGTSTSSNQSSSIKKFEEKIYDVDSTTSKSTKDEDGWPEIDSEDSKKGNVDDGWGTICETNNGSLGTSKFTEKKYEPTSQHRTSSQSAAVSNRANQYPNSKENFKRSASMPSSEPVPMRGRFRQDFGGKDQYNSASCSQSASSAERDFNGKIHNQDGISTSFAQYSSMRTKQDFNSRETDETVLEKENKKCNNYTGQVDKKGESGWPKLDINEGRRHSYDDGDDWNTITREKENQKELSGNRTTSYQRSVSTPSDQSSKYAKRNNWEESSQNRRYNENGGGDCSTSFPRSDRSKFEQRKQFPSQPQFTRSSSFRDRTNFRGADVGTDNISNKTHSNYQGLRSRAADDCNPGYSNSYHRNEQAGSNSFHQASKMTGAACSSQDIVWKKAWRENSQVESNRNTDCSNEPKMAESINQAQPYTHNRNRSETTLHKENNSLKDDVQRVDSSDEWCTMSETSEVSTIVLEDDLEEEHRVVQTSSDLKNITITFNCSKKDNLIKSKSIEDTSQNSSDYKEIEDEVLLAQGYSDPLESFFANASDPVIPPPRPASNPETSIAVSSVEMHTTESKDCSSSTELDPGKSETSCKVVDGIPDARQFQEITSFLNDLEAEKSMPVEIANKIFNDVVGTVKYYVKGYWVHRYGSYVSGLAVSTSNFNLALEADKQMALKNSFLLQLQKTFSKALESKGYQVEPFDEDRNPKKSKICLTETESGVTCEIGYLWSRISNYRKMDSMLFDVCKFDSRIKTLLIATRIWAEVCFINEVEEGKLHSIGYTLLMLHFLQGLEKPLLPILDVDLASSKNWGLNPLEVTNDSSIGELWLAFLKYYSREFNWDENVVTIHSKTTVLKSSKPWGMALIAIEDPFNQTNIADTVVSAECAECIFSCFKASYQYFSTPVDYEDSDSGISGSQNNNSKKETFSFYDITFDQNLPSFCEACDELNKPCGKCRPSTKDILQPLPALSPSSLKYVNTALYDVYEEFILPDNKIEGRKAFVHDLENYVKQIYSTAKLTLFGSSVNAFGFKRSDLDICMTLSYKPKSTGESAAILRNFVRHLRKKPQHYDNVFGLYHAKIPIVKFHFIPEDWNCDLSLYNVLAVHNSNLLCKYALFDERCRILGCAMKLLAKKANLDDTRSLSSYSYILTVIHYLQQVEPPVLPVFPVEDKKVFEEMLKVPKAVLEGRNYWLYEDIEKLKNRYLPHPQNKSSVGELWLGLLDFYARYDGTHAVTITQKEPLPSTDLRRCARLLNIQDPFLAKDNLGCILTDTRAEKTRKVLGRARLLFGKEVQEDCQDNPKKYFFSSSHLTGIYIKDVECHGCGGFGHEKSDCLKANPFKYSQFKYRTPKNRRQPYYMRKV